MKTAYTIFMSVIITLVVQGMIDGVRRNNAFKFVDQEFDKAAEKWDVPMMSVWVAIEKTEAAKIRPPIATPNAVSSLIHPTTPKAERIARRIVVISLVSAGFLMLGVCCLALIVALVEYRGKTNKRDQIS